MFRLYSDLTKFGIVIFVLLTGLAGYLYGFVVERPFDLTHLMYFMGGLYFISSGSLALNQVQEYKLDQKMKRTERRPIASGRLKPAAGGILAVTFIVIGSDLLLKVNVPTVLLGWVTVILYNGFYTYWWKRKWIYAALPGAIPGALPVLMGFVAQSGNFGEMPGWFLFTILFLWQMPHFWLLAIRYKDDYKAAQVPTLPVALGLPQTMLQIRLYTLLYVASALMTPWFLESKWAYMFLTVPMGLVGLFFMQKYAHNTSGRNWFIFFMWTNLSILVFLFAPCVDRWRLIMSAFQIS